MWPTMREGNVTYDVPSRLLKDRIILLMEEVTPQLSASIICQLLFLEKEDPKAPIKIYINSPGGSVSDGLAIYDMMKHVSCPVETYCVGMAASMAAVLLMAGDKGKRYAMPNSVVMIHQPSGGCRGQASDIQIQAERIIELKTKLNKIIQNSTNLTPDEITVYVERDTYIEPQKAKEWGIIDKVVGEKDAEFQAHS